jgi:hypothetical protein
MSTVDGCVLDVCSGANVRFAPSADRNGPTGTIHPTWDLTDRPVQDRGAQEFGVRTDILGAAPLTPGMDVLRPSRLTWPCPPWVTRAPAKSCWVSEAGMVHRRARQDLVSR